MELLREHYQNQECKMTASGIDWQRVAGSLKDECPSPSVRAAAAELLVSLEMIGPLRPPADEFRRVYRSLTWNEPERVREVVEVLKARTAGLDPQMTIRAEAWEYTMAALDEWIAHARILYLVIGILESALRARIHARMTDYFGTSEWPNAPKALTGPLRDRAVGRAREQQLEKAAKLISQAEPGSLTLEQHRALLTDLRAAIEQPALPQLPSGDEYLRKSITLYDLLQWLGTRRFWGDPVRLEDIFRGKSATQSPPQYDKLKAVFTRLHAARNRMAHYRTESDLSFAEALFAASQLADWLGEDLGHIYSAIDTRSSTELSSIVTFLGNTDANWNMRDDYQRCVYAECRTYPPLDWLLERAPRERGELHGIPIERACLYHRVVLRHEYHRGIRE